VLRSTRTSRFPRRPFKVATPPDNLLSVPTTLQVAAAQPGVLTKNQTGSAGNTGLLPKTSARNQGVAVASDPQIR
jgi:hypothetical protein